MFALRFSKQSRKALLRLPNEVAEQMRTELGRISEDPAAYRGDWKLMKGTPFWRLRVRQWRAVCSVCNEELVILVIKIGSRGDVYK